MYFDEAPKASKKDIFNYSEEFQELLSSLSEARRMLQIKGSKRSGQDFPRHFVIKKVGSPVV